MRATEVTATFTNGQSMTLAKVAELQITHAGGYMVMPPSDWLQIAETRARQDDSRRRDCAAIVLGGILSNPNVTDTADIEALADAALRAADALLARCER